MNSILQGFHSLFDLIPQINFVADSSCEKIFFNQQWMEFAGGKSQEILLSDWAKYVHPEEVETFHTTWAAARSSGNTWSCEYRLRRRDGQFRWHFGKSVAEKTKDGEIFRWVGIMTEVEDQKAAQQLLNQSGKTLELRSHERNTELAQAYSFLDSILENIPNMIFIKDAKTLRFVRFNRAGEELTGYGRENLIGKNDMDFFPHDEALHFQEKDRAVLEGGVLVDIPEEKISTARNGVRILHTKKLPIFSPEGVPTYLLGISEDITEKKRAEEARLHFMQAELAAKEAKKTADRMNLLAEASALLGASLDYETTLLNLTKLAVPGLADWCSIRLLQPDKTLKQIAVAHTDPLKAQWATNLDQKYPLDPNWPTGPYNVLRTGKPEMLSQITSEMIAQTARDPEHLKILEELGFKSYICAPIRARGEILGCLILVTTAESKRAYESEDLRLAVDLCERAGYAIENSRLYREAQFLNRVKDEFLATLSHELRTPLNVILGHSEILKSELSHLTSRESETSIDAIFRNAKIQMGLIGDLLDMSSIITGKISFLPVHINPLEILESATAGLIPVARAKGVELTTNYAGAPTIAFADPMRLNQILWNLASNAIKFTPVGGKVKVQVTSSAEDWQILVEDTGKGIEASFLPYVFDRFRQEEASNTRNFGGLGLGLSIVRQLVEMHGGQVTAASVGRDLRSQFIVRLPLGPQVRSISAEPNIESSTVTKPTIVSSEPAKLEGVNVLLVEDSPDNRALVALLLTRAGAAVIEADSAEGARAKLERAKLRLSLPHVILCDIGLPGESGLEFMRALRESGDSATHWIPAIALTAYVRPEEVVQSLEAGFQAHVAKPISWPQLFQTIRNLVPTK